MKGLELKFFIRSLKRNRLSTIINLFGLMLAFATCITIFSYNQYETSYDQQYLKQDRIYRLYRAKCPVFPIKWMDYVGPKLKGVEDVVKLYGSKDYVSVESKHFLDKKIYYVENSFLKAFDVKILSGSLLDNFKNKKALAISSSLAKEIFGNENPIGKEILLGGKKKLMVMAVFKDFMQQSSVRADILIPLDNLKDSFTFLFNSIHASATHMFFVLNKGYDYHDVLNQLNAYSKNDEETRRNISSIGFKLQALNEVHLNSEDMSWDFEKRGSGSNLKLYIVISLVLLLIAIFNYVNLVTARTSLRTKEVGVKKVIGASRGKLIFQFLLEPIIIALMALVLSFIFIEIGLDGISFFLSTEVVNVFFNYKVILFALSLSLLTGILAGLYPAFILSSFSPIDALKRNSALKKSRSGIFSLRKILVVTQFLATSTLLLLSLFMWKQLNFLEDKDLGYEVDNTIVIQNPDRGRRSDIYNTIRDEIGQRADVVGVEASSLAPCELMTIYNMITGVYKGREVSQKIGVVSVTSAFFTVMESKLLKGEMFPTIPNVQDKYCLINESLYKELGEEVIGKELGCFYDGKTRRVIGVINDVHFSSLYYKAIPSVYCSTQGQTPDCLNNLYIKFNKGDEKEQLKIVKDLYDSKFSSLPVQISPLSQIVTDLYSKEQKSFNLELLLNVLVMLVAIMGLFGLVFFILERKEKELALHIVHGAGLKHLIYLISREFLWVIFFSWVVSIPLAYFLMDYWVRNFMYVVRINPIIVLIPLVLLLLVVFAIVAWQLNYQLKSKPVDSLKSE
ncbi:MAG: ABC transporter permease [Bacteroidales bacterium]